MNPREVGLETYDLSRAVAMTPEQALHTALDATWQAASRSCLEAMRDNILMTAEEIDADDDNDLNEDGPASLIWFAMLIDDMLPPELRKEITNADGV